MWTMRMHIQTLSTAAIDYPHISGPVYLLEIDLEKRPTEILEVDAGPSRQRIPRSRVPEAWSWRSGTGSRWVHEENKVQEDLKNMVLLSWCCRNDCPRNFLMSLNDPKELHRKIKVYTSPKQTPIDLLLIQRNAITSTPQNIIQEKGDISLF